MKILIKQAKITDKNSPFNGMTKDILIEGDTIVKIEDIFLYSLKCYLYGY